MKIVMVSHYFESHRGGIEIVAGQLARAFTQQGHHVTWAACDSDAAPADPSICAEVVALPANNILERRIGVPYPVPMPKAAPLLARALRDADVLVMQDANFLPCLLAQIAARRGGVPVLLVQHIGLVPYRNPVLRAAMTAMSRLLTQRALVAAEQVVFISDLTRRTFASLAYRRSPMMLLNGVDQLIFRPAPGERERHEARRSLGLDADRPTMLFVGRFVEKKGLDHIRHMAKRRPDWNWILAGWGPIDPAGWKLPNVSVFADRSGRSLTALYWSADALVLPSVGEGYPLVVQEALACGLPVVCGADTARADPAAIALLSGATVRAEDPSGTAAAFLDRLDPIIGNGGPSEAERRARSAFAHDRYSWSGTAASLVSLASSLTVARGQRVALPVRVVV
jgi:glycosyltransferase involved in cell wall biosynthesis